MNDLITTNGNVEQNLRFYLLKNRSGTITDLHNIEYLSQKLRTHSAVQNNYKLSLRRKYNHFLNLNIINLGYLIFFALNKMYSYNIDYHKINYDQIENIPRRFSPVLTEFDIKTELNDKYTNKECIKQLTKRDSKYYYFEISPQLLSYMEHKKIFPRYVELLKEYSSKDKGVTFDKYIDDISWRMLRTSNQDIANSLMRLPNEKR